MGMRDWEVDEWAWFLIILGIVICGVIDALHGKSPW
jgi:hypothetical protein